MITLLVFSPLSFSATYLYVCIRLFHTMYSEMRRVILAGAAAWRDYMEKINSRDENVHTMDTPKAPEPPSCPVFAKGEREMSRWDCVFIICFRL